MIKIGIIGNGFVGKATQQLENKEVELYCYDINPLLCHPLNLTLNELCNISDIIFISVPTPMNLDGSCYTKILENVVNDIEKICDLNEKLVVIRSTIPPGLTDKLNCYFMPEFLTEKNFMNDFKNNKEWIFGIKNKKQDIIFKNNIQKLFDSALKYNKIKSNRCVFIKNKEAEMVKLFRNTFLATKISFCNEIYDFCSLENIDYNTMIKYASDDSRISQSHTSVPGHDTKRGFGGTCFPKDINNLYSLMKKNNQKSLIIKNVIKRNEQFDRKEKDWLNDKGRTII